MPDLRNSKIVDILAELREYQVQAWYTTLASPAEALHEYGVILHPMTDLRDLDALILAVGHDAFRDLTQDQLQAMFKKTHPPIIMDVKGVLSAHALPPLSTYWRL